MGGGCGGVDGKGGTTGSPAGHRGGGLWGGVDGGGELGGGEVGSGASGGGLVGEGEAGGWLGGGGGLGTMGWLIAVMWWNAVICAFSRQQRYHSPSGMEYTPCRFSSRKLVSGGAMGPTVQSWLVASSQ